MNFTGWVPLRRGLVEHMSTGKLSSQEAIVLVTLIALADKETGSGTINAPSLRSFIPDLSYDAAKRALQSLQTKRYIYRLIVPFSKRVYRYWVNKYEPSAGPHKLLQTDLSEVFATRDVSKVRYIKAAPQGALVTAPQGAPQGAPNNNKDKDNQQQTPIPVSGSGGTNDAPTALQVETGCAREAATCGKGGAPQVRPSPPSGHLQVPSSVAPTGIDLHWMGTDAGFRDSSGKPVYYESVNERILPLNMSWQNGGFFRIDNHALIPWTDAIALIDKASNQRRPT